jgi:hypothetical protein
MISNSDIKPPILMNLGDGSWHYNYNIKEVTMPVTIESGEEKTAFEYETVHVWGKPGYEKLVPLVVATKYDTSKELSLTGKYNDFVLGISTNIADKTEYEAYRNEVLSIKAMIKADLQLVTDKN